MCASGDIMFGHFSCGWSRVAARGADWGSGRPRKGPSNVQAAVTCIALLFLELTNTSYIRCRIDPSLHPMIIHRATWPWHSVLCSPTFSDGFLFAYRGPEIQLMQFRCRLHTSVLTAVRFHAVGTRCQRLRASQLGFGKEASNAEP